MREMREALARVQVLVAEWPKEYRQRKHGNDGASYGGRSKSLPQIIEN